jgi:ADP-heptose:LPS heptosyltransferase
MLVPLLKHLKQKGKVTLIGTSVFGGHEVFKGFETPLYDQFVVLDSSLDWLKHSASFRKNFDAVYLDYFAATRKNLMLAHVIGKSTVTNNVPRKLPNIFRKKIRKVKPILGLHEGAQYMRFIDDNFTDASIDASMFSLKSKGNHVFENLQKGYITLQPGCGNNAAPWKAWGLEKWESVINELTIKTDHTLVVLGDESETELSQALPTNDNVLNLIGQTDIDHLPAILEGASLHIGHDSGLMHIAGCVGTPTITVWGGSDPELFGWQKIDRSKHRVLQKKLSCHPCNRWISPNTSKVELPSMCPDFECLQQISARMLLDVIYESINA